MNKYTKTIENLLAKQIRDEMSKMRFPEFCGGISDSDKEEFVIVRKVASLITELLKNKETKELLIELSNKSIVNGENNDIKMEFFETIRNIIVHFPFFNSWSEVYICKDMLKWNGKKNGQIEKFFEKNKNCKLTYHIYTKLNGEWTERHQVDVKIPELFADKIIYMKNIISLEDVVWTFCVIDYYLDYMGYVLDKYTGLSI